MWCIFDFFTTVRNLFFCLPIIRTRSKQQLILFQHLKTISGLVLNQKSKWNNFFSQLIFFSCIFSSCIIQSSMKQNHIKTTKNRVHRRAWHHVVGWFQLFCLKLDEMIYFERSRIPKKKKNNNNNVTKQTTSYFSTYDDVYVSNDAYVSYAT
jgi:uncharacterized membrane protein